jgi:hypothetical protein
MNAPEPPAGLRPTPDDTTPPSTAVTGALEQYFRENLGSTTETVLKEAARAAGHAQAAIDAAWNAANLQAPSVGGRATQAILAAYGATFALLSLGMLLNSSSSRGEFMPDGPAGILILAISLGVTFVASMLWIASRRAFWSIVALVAILAGFPSLGYSPVQGIAVVAGAVGILWVVWRRDWRDLGTRADIGVLLVVPILLLIGVAGICLASGLPFPSARGS